MISHDDIFINLSGYFEQNEDSSYELHKALPKTYHFTEGWSVSLVEIFLARQKSEISPGEELRKMPYLLSFESDICTPSILNDQLRSSLRIFCASQDFGIKPFHQIYDSNERPILLKVKLFNTLDIKLKVLNGQNLVANQIWAHIVLKFSRI